MADISIRLARADETDILTDIAMLSKQSVGYDDAFMAACADELRVTPALLAKNDHWVAEADTPCGFISLAVDEGGEKGVLDSLFIHPDWQKKGVGRRLWDILLVEARARNLRELRLDSDPKAEHFYSSLGFTTISRAPSGSIPGRTLPHMTIVL